MKIITAVVASLFIMMGIGAAQAATPDQIAEQMLKVDVPQAEPIAFRPATLAMDPVQGMTPDYVGQAVREGALNAAASREVNNLASMLGGGPLGRSAAEAVMFGSAVVPDKWSPTVAGYTQAHNGLVESAINVVPMVGQNARLTDGVVAAQFAKDPNLDPRYRGALGYMARHDPNGGVLVSVAGENESTGLQTALDALGQGVKDVDEKYGKKVGGLYGRLKGWRGSENSWYRLNSQRFGVEGADLK